MGVYGPITREAKTEGSEFKPDWASQQDIVSKPMKKERNSSCLTVLI